MWDFHENHRPVVLILFSVFLIQIVSTYFGHNSLPWQPTPEADSLSQKWRQIRFFTALKKIKTTSSTLKVPHVELSKVQHLKKTGLKRLKNLVLTLAPLKNRL